MHKTIILIMTAAVELQKLQTFVKPDDRVQQHDLRKTQRASCENEEKLTFCA